MFLLNGQPLQLDTQFEINGTIYPANWLRLTSIEEKNAVGITEVPDAAPESYDDRFYWGPNNPKDLTQLKTTWSAWVDDTAWNLLNKTDYMDFRHLTDSTYTAPAAWVTWRTAVRTTLKDAKAAIAAATDVPGLQKVIAVQWPLDPNAQTAQASATTNTASTTATATPSATASTTTTGA